MGLYSLMLSGGIATGTVLAGISDDLGGVQAVFYSAAIIFGGLGLTSAWLLRKQQSLAKRAVDLNSSASKPIQQPMLFAFSCGPVDQPGMLTVVRPRIARLAGPAIGTLFAGRH